jgi:FAD/FMN-containing dehydrogenase
MVDGQTPALNLAALAAFGDGFMGEIVLPDSAGYDAALNDMVESGDDVVRGIYGSEKYERLVELKRAYDPDNVFRLNQNIRP